MPTCLMMSADDDDQDKIRHIQMREAKSSKAWVLPMSAGPVGPAPGHARVQGVRGDNRTQEWKAHAVCISLQATLAIGLSSSSCSFYPNNQLNWLPRMYFPSDVLLH